MACIAFTVVLDAGDIRHRACDRGTSVLIAPNEHQFEGTPSGGLDDIRDVYITGIRNRLQSGNSDHAGQGGERPCQI